MREAGLCWFQSGLPYVTGWCTKTFSLWLLKVKRDPRRVLKGKFCPLCYHHSLFNVTALAVVVCILPHSPTATDSFDLISICHVPAHAFRPKAAAALFPGH